MERSLIERLGEKHRDWLNMALSFGCSWEEANELVQLMYVRIVKYVDDAEKIMYNEKEVNTYYVYVTLRNLFLSKQHVYKIDFDIENASEQFASVIDFDYEEAHKELFEKIDGIVDNWYWYDKKLWNIHFKDLMSMRGISSATKISLSSIFNTLKNGKEKVRKETQKEYQKYVKSKINKEKHN